MKQAEDARKGYAALNNTIAAGYAALDDTIAAKLETAYRKALAAHALTMSKVAKDAGALAEELWSSIRMLSSRSSWSFMRKDVRGHRSTSAVNGIPCARSSCQHGLPQHRQANPCSSSWIKACEIFLLWT